MTQKAYTSGSSFPELKKDTLRVYSSRICPYAERVRLVLAHKNIQHEIVNVDLKNKPEWFLAKTPLGKVPVIECGDTILYESTAVSEYLDDVYPGDKLQPSDPKTKAKDRILLERFGELTTSYYRMVIALREDAKKEDIDSKAETINKHVGVYEEALALRDGPFFGGPTPAILDFYVWPHMERLPALTKMVPEVGLTTSKFPSLCKWWDAMIQLPAVKKEMFDADWHLQVFKLSKEGKPYGDHGLKESD